MITVMPFNTKISLNITELSKLKGASSVSVFSAGKDILFSSSNSEFSKMYILTGGNTRAASLNYRIPLEVIRLLLKSECIDTKVSNDGLYLLIEEITTKDSESKQLLIYLRYLTAATLTETLKESKAEATPYLESVGYKLSRELFRVPYSIDYDIATKLTWYAGLKSPAVEKYEMDVLNSFKEMYDFSAAFKTGICIKDGLAYADSSKIGIEAYRFIDYDGDEMLLSYSCMATLYDFAKTRAEELRFFKCHEYRVATTINNILLIWKNIRFTLEPNIDDLRASRYDAVFETDLRRFSGIISTIYANKANQIFCDIDFMKDSMVIRDASKGEYKFNVQFNQLAQVSDLSDADTKLSIKFQTLKSVLMAKSSYNRIRFFLYANFIRVDFISLIEERSSEEEDEDEEPEISYDSAGKLTIVMGRGV